MTADGKNWIGALPSKILVLAAAYFVVGILTLAANIPPVIVTVVWLPAGIALTATLVWGYRISFRMRLFVILPVCLATILTVLAFICPTAV